MDPEFHWFGDTAIRVDQIQAFALAPQQRTTVYLNGGQIITATITPDDFAAQLATIRLPG